MRVNANSELSGLNAIQTARSKAQKPGPEKDKLTLAGTQQLNQTLAKVPEVRSEKVAQARQLISDPSYPSEAQLGKIANLLADNIQPPNSQSPPKAR